MGGGHWLLVLGPWSLVLGPLEKEVVCYFDS